MLSARQIAHATIDLDAIGTVLLPDDVARDLVSRNLEAIYANVVGAGITRILLAEAVEDRDGLSRLRRAMPGAEIVVCRLTATVETMERRLRTREPGMLQEQFVARAASSIACWSVRHWKTSPSRTTAHRSPTSRASSWSAPGGFAA